MIIIPQEAFFAGTTCLHWVGKKEHGTIFNLDVLIAAFQFGNEHLMLKVTLSGLCWQTDMRGAVPAISNICLVWWKHSFCRCIIKQKWEDWGAENIQEIGLSEVSFLQTWTDGKPRYTTKVWLARTLILPLDRVNYDAEVSDWPYDCNWLCWWGVKWWDMIKARGACHFGIKLSAVCSLKCYVCGFDVVNQFWIHVFFLNQWWIGWVWLSCCIL